MLIPDPHYPHIVFDFTYQACRIQVEKDAFKGQDIYAAWVDHAAGSALAVPFAFSRAEAIRKAKQWVRSRQMSRLTSPYLD